MGEPMTLVVLAIARFPEDKETSKRFRIGGFGSGLLPTHQRLTFAIAMCYPDLAKRSPNRYTAIG